MPAPARIPRLTTGVKIVDDWIDMIVAKIESCLNISGADGINVRRTPFGTQIALNLSSQMVLAQAGTGGITARNATSGLPGSGPVNIYSWQGGTGAPVNIYSDTAYNIGGTPSGGSGTIAAGTWLILGRVGKLWFVIVQACN